jgi:hypothetical protein
MALHIMQEFLAFRGLDFRMWCEAVTAFDMFTIRGGHENKALKVEQLIITCVAIVRLVEKANNGPAMRWPFDNSSSMIAHLKERFRGLMPLDSVIIESNIVSCREREIMMVLNMKLRTCPSVHDWLSTIGVRFDVISGGIMAARLEFSWKFCTNCAKVLTYSVPLSAELSPQRVAIGLFTLSLLCTGVLCRELFKPQNLTEEEWEHRMNLPPLRLLPGASVLMSSIHPEPLKVLQAATRCNLEELKAHVDVITSSIAVVVQLTHPESN